MNDTPDSCEAELAECFQEDPEFGLKYLNETHRESIFRYIKSKARGLDAHEIGDVYQETMRELVLKVKDQNFNWNNPMAIVLRIACTNAIDAARRKGYRAREGDDAELPFIAADMRDTRLYHRWRQQDPVAQREFKSVLNEIVDALPASKQKVVAICFVQEFPNLREREKWTPLAQAVSAVTGEPEAAATVKAAWHEVRKKIAEQLERRGFKFLE